MNGAGEFCGMLVRKSHQRYDHTLLERGPMEKRDAGTPTREELTDALFEKYPPEVIALRLVEFLNQKGRCAAKEVLRILGTDNPDTAWFVVNCRCSACLHVQ